MSKTICPELQQTRCSRSSSSLCFCLSHTHKETQTHTHTHTHKHTQQTAVALMCIKNGSNYCTATKDCKQRRYFISFISPTMHRWMLFPSHMNSCVILNQKGWKVHFNFQKICHSWIDKAGLHVAGKQGKQHHNAH